jgi:hypothetical protein
MLSEKGAKELRKSLSRSRIKWKERKNYDSRNKLVFFSHFPHFLYCIRKENGEKNGEKKEE